MNKKYSLMIITVLVLIVSSISGCVDVDVPEDIVDNIMQLSITNFVVEPSIITKGETANLSWTVINARTVSIDNGIGSVSLTGTRIIMPTGTTTYILTATNDTTTLTATTQIIVNEPSEPPEPPDPPSTLSMNTFSQNDATNTRIWLVSGIEGEAIADTSYSWSLLDATGANASGATCAFNEVTGSGYVNAGDTFTLVAPADGYYVFMLTYKSTGSTIYKSSSAKY